MPAESFSFQSGTSNTIRESVHPAYTSERVCAVVADVEAAHPAERPADCSVAEFLDLVAREDTHGRWDVGDLFGNARCRLSAASAGSPKAATHARVKMTRAFILRLLRGESAM
jgi:hypothetical protein